MHLLNRPSWLLKGLGEPNILLELLIFDYAWCTYDELVDGVEGVLKDSVVLTAKENMMVKFI